MKKLKIIIGYDGSACADAALDDLKKAGMPLKADALVISVADVFIPTGKNMIDLPPDMRSVLERSRRIAKRQLQLAALTTKKGARKIKALFPDWSVKAASFADSPAWALTKKAEEWRADLILVGAHGHAGLGRFFGSVSQMVLTQAECSVRVGRASVNPGKKPPRILIGMDG